MPALIAADWMPEDDAPWDRLPSELHVTDEVFWPFCRSLIQVKCDECYRPDRKGARTVFCDLHRCEHILRGGTRCKQANGFAFLGDVGPLCDRHDTQVGEPA